MLEKLCTTLTPDEREALATIYREAADWLSAQAALVRTNFGPTTIWTAACLTARKYRDAANILAPLDE